MSSEGSGSVTVVVSRNDRVSGQGLRERAGLKAKTSLCLTTPKGGPAAPPSQFVALFGTWPPSKGNVVSGGLGGMKPHPRKNAVAHSCMGKSDTSTHYSELMLTVWCVALLIVWCVALVTVWCVALVTVWCVALVTVWCVALITVCCVVLVTVCQKVSQGYTRSVRGLV